MNRFLAALLITLFACGEPVEPGASVRDIAQPWVTASPGDVGADQSRIARAVERAGDEPRVLSLLAVKNGRLVVEEYFNGNSRSTRNDVRSVTKSIVSALTGIALDRGAIDSLDQLILDLVDTTDIALTGDQRLITVRHLLTMTSGFEWHETNGPEYGDWILSADHLDYLLTRPMADTPGATFEYNSAAVYLLGLVLEHATGVPLADYAERHLFSPIGITSVEWEALRNGEVNGGAGIDLRPRDLARFGQLFLQNGLAAEDRRVLAEDWVDNAVRPHFTWTFDVGGVQGMTYGLLWWPVTGLPERAFVAWGYGGQFIYVVPELDLVMVTTTNYRGLLAEGGPRPLEEALLTILSQDLLPAFR